MSSSNRGSAGTLFKVDWRQGRGSWSFARPRFEGWGGIGVDLSITELFNSSWLSNSWQFWFKCLVT